MSTNYLKTLWKSSVMILFLCLGLSSWGQETITIVPNQATTGTSATAYVATLTEFTAEEIDWAINNWNPNSLQVRGNQSTVSANFQFYNTVAIPGNITKITLNTNPNTAVDGTTSPRLNSNNISVVFGATEQSGTSTGVTGTAGTNLIYWEPSTSSTFFRIQFVNGATSGVALIASIVVEYETAPSGDHTITVTQPLGGDITPGTTGVEDGGNVSFLATPESVCYTFSHWVVDGVNAGSANPYEFTNVTADYTITAVFNATGTYEIAATAGANGSISPNGTTEVNCGEDQTFIIIPNVGYTIADVLVNGVSVGAVATYTFENVTENQTIAVSFVEYVAPENYDGIGVFEKITSVSDLTDGYYVIVNENETHLMANTRAGNFFDGVAATIADDLIVNPSVNHVWKIEIDGAGRTIYNDVTEKYVGYTGTQNTASAEDAPADTNRWTFTYTDNKFSVNNVANTVRQLSYNYNNGTNPRFAAYGNANQEELILYKLSTGATPNPTLAVAPATITGLNYGLGNGPSTAQSFVLSGNNLDGSDVTVTAPANFEVSTTEASGYASSITLTAFDGANQTVWVRLSAGQLVNTYNGSVTISGGGATDATVSVSGAVLAVPVVTSETFNGTVGESFSAQITATENPTSYTYTGTLPTGLNFNTTTGAITGTPEAAGSSDIQVTATNIVGTSTSATVSIVIAQGTQTIAGLSDINTTLGAADITLPATTSAGLTISYSSSDTAVATVSANTVSIVGLGTTTITATQAGNANWEAFNEEITLTVIDASSADCFEEDFSDITNGNSTSSTGSNTAWDGNSNFPTVTNAYQAGGKVRLGSSSSNGSITSVALTAFQGQSVTVSFDAKSWATSATSILVTLGTESQVVELAAPAEWESDLTSYEIEFENVEANATLTFASNNNSARRFFLDNIAVCISEVSIDPILNVTSASITGLNYGLGSGPSVAQSFVLSGNNLDGSDVTVSAPANFEVSTTEASGYASSITLTAFDGANQTVWVRLSAGQLVNTYNGSVTISGGGATDATVSVSGAVLAVPVVTSETFNGTVGVAFSAQITATENPTSYAYTGTLPTGLNFNTTTGAITGTPEAAGSSDIQVTATNIVGTSTSATVSIVVAQGTQIIAEFTDINTVLGAADITLPETTNAGLTVSYLSSNTDVATVSGNTVSIVGVGTTTITASQAGNANWGTFSQDITITVVDTSDFYNGIGVFEKVTSETDLTDGYYVVTNETGAFLMTNGRSGSDTAGFFVSADSDALSVYIVNPTAANVWKIETSGAGKTIYNEVSEKYVGWSSGNGASIEDTPADTNRWTFTYADNKFTVNNVAEPVRQLSYNATNPRFAAYGNNGQQELQLFKLVPSTSWNGTVWSNGEPNDTKVVVIEGAITVGASGSVKSLIVTENGSVNIPNGSSVTVDGVIINVASATDFVVESGAALIQNQDVENIGEITVNRNSNSMKLLDYTMWSSPVAGQGIQAFSPETLSNRIYKYDAVENAYVNTFAETEFQEGHAYLFRAPNNFTDTPQVYNGVFTGVANNGNVSVAVTAEAYNGLGNPYPSAIDADALFAENTQMLSLYFWTNTNAPVDGVYVENNYATYTLLGGVGTDPADNSATVPNGEIAVGQGFIAEIASGATQVAFNNSMRLGNGGMFFREMNEEKHRLWLSLSNEESTYNKLLIGYMEGASTDYDAQIDGEMFDYNGSAIYSLIEDHSGKFVIQGREPFVITDVVPLGLRIINGGEFTISLTNFDGLFDVENQDIYLRDNLTQAEHDLKEGAYTFISDEGTFETRFEIIYQTTMSVTNPDLENYNWIVFKQGESFQIQTQGFEMQQVEVFDMLGRNVYTAQAEGQAHNIKALGATGVYIVKVTTSENKVLTKKVKN